jgi:hypothetical protein
MATPSRIPVALPTRCVLALVFGLLLGACRPAPRGVSSSPATPPASLFRLESRFWINLHHDLYQYGLLRQPQQGMPRIAGVDAKPLEGLVAGEQAAWDEAVAYYAAQLCQRSLLFDDDLVAIDNTLAAVADDAALPRAGLDPALSAVLGRAAPVYRAHLWQERDRGNRRFIETLRPLVATWGRMLQRDLAAAYRTPWPAEPLLVSVVGYAGRTGAYTSLDPLHIRIASGDSRHQALYGLEILFHEASHGLIDPIREELARVCRAAGKPVPDDLWHVLLFYTTGQVVARHLRGYETYADVQGLYSRAPRWAEYRRALVAHWQPYLEGRVDFDRAMAQLVAGLQL